MSVTYEWIAPCHFGLEAVLKNELTALGYEITETTDGRVTFRGGIEAAARANIFLRTAERVLLKAGSFTARSFDELFEGTKALPWEEFIPKDGRVWVTKASSVKSQLFSPSDIQSVMKKAIVERMKAAMHLAVIPETGASFPLRVFLWVSIPPARRCTSAATGRAPWRRPFPRRSRPRSSNSLRGTKTASWWIRSAAAAPSPSKRR